MVISVSIGLSAIAPLDAPAQATPSTSLQGRQASKRPAKKKVAPAAEPVEAAVPFRPGETLEYAAQWNKFVTAATIKVSVVSRGAFFGRNAWHFQATAHTLELVRLLYALDDQFDSYTDANSLSSMQYESYIREQAKRQDLIVPMATAPGPTKSAPAAHGKAGSNQPPGESDPRTSRGDTHVYLVLPGTRDPLDLLYSLRAQNWTREPATRFPVFDGRHYYEVAAQKESAGDEVQVAVGSYHVTRVALRVFEAGREMPNVKFWVSLAQDEARTPVLIEAELPFGTVRVEATAVH